MKRSRFTDSQIITILKQAEAGAPVPELCREHGISSASFYKWRSKFGGMDATLMSRLKELEEENRRLKKMYVEERLRPKLLRKQWQKSGEAIRPEADGAVCGRTPGAQYPSGLSALCRQRLLLPLLALTESEKSDNCRLAGLYHRQPVKLGLWPVLSVSAQRKRLRLEPQKNLPDLLRTVVEYADKT